MASATSTNPAHAHFESFLQAQLCQDVLSSFQGLCRALELEPGGGLPQYHKIKAQLNYWSAKSLWAKLDKRASQPVYQQGRACTSTKCLVVGAGPCGLRAAVELAMLGARVVLVEKRTKFSRHNVVQGACAEAPMTFGHSAPRSSMGASAQAPWTTSASGNCSWFC